MTTWGVLQQKGGVGKTTLALNFADALAIKGRRVLVIDGDKQGAATSALIGDFAGGADETTLADVLTAPSPTNAIRGAVLKADGQWGNYDGGPPIHVIAGSLDLEDVWAGHSADLAFRLRNALLKSGILDEYDDVILDGPPDLGAGTASLAISSDYLLLPTLGEWWSLTGLARTLALLDTLRENVVKPGVPKMLLAGIVPMAINAQLNENKLRLGELRGRYGADVTTATIPHRFKANEASGQGASGRMLSGPAGIVLGARYTELAVELFAKLGLGGL